MALTDEERQKRISAFLDNKKQEETDAEEYEDIWTEEDLIEIAHKILKRLGLDGKYK